MISFRSTSFNFEFLNILLKVCRERVTVMARHVSLCLYFIMFGSGLLFPICPSNTWAHSGHKHDELKIKLPKVVAQVNGENITGDVISRELKKAAQQYKKRGMPLNVDQEKGYLCFKLRFC